MRSFLMAVLMLVLSPSAYSQAKHEQETLSLAPPKTRVWSFEMAMLRYAQRGYSGHAVDGTGGRFSIGYGTVKSNYFLLGNFDVYLGPFGIDFRTVQLDYQATGFSVIAGSGLETISLRGDDMGFGVLGGIAYQEFSGKSYGRNDVDKPVPANSPLGIVTAYNSQIVAVDLNFGFFMSLVKPSRLDEHDSDALVTRNEGVILSIQGSVPIFSRFRSNFKVMDKKGVQQPQKEVGSLAGFCVLLSLRTFLGT